VMVDARVVKQGKTFVFSKGHTGDVPGTQTERTRFPQLERQYGR
jgi:hypothetical protein